MKDAATDLDVVFETTVFLHHFSDLPDSRQPGKVVYPLNEVLLLSLLAVLAGAESFTDIARFGEKKLSLLRRFLPFADGTPPHDRLGEIFAALDAAAFQRCFVEWVAALTKTPVEVIAIDGKTMRGTNGGKDSKAAIHMVSAFAARQRLVLAQVKVDAKSNEIAAIPALLDLMAIEGAVVTIDAMGCQRDIAEKIVAKKADYILALKGNQGTLREDVEVFANEQKARDFQDTTISTHKTADADHGRIETRNYTLIHDAGWLQERHKWPGMKGVLMVESQREYNGKIERETRFYITSSTLEAQTLGPMIRSHWAIENSLHWAAQASALPSQSKSPTRMTARFRSATQLSAERFSRFGFLLPAVAMGFAMRRTARCPHTLRLLGQSHFLCPLASPAFVSANTRGCPHSR